MKSDTMIDSVLLSIDSNADQVDGDKSELRAIVDGHAVFFSSDLLVANHYEALLTCFAIPAMKSGRMLSAPAGTVVSKLWCENVREASSLIAHWWGFHPIQVKTETTERLTSTSDAGLFFTGGVDSSYSLVKNRGKVTRLINVEGFDVAFDDDERLEATALLINHIANAEGLEVVRVRTNLREHPFFRSVKWGKTHGSALAGIAHLLSPHLRKVFVASSDVHEPHGSHPQLDPLWSSDCMDIIYDSPGVARLDKVDAIKLVPWVDTHLKVCWENREKRLNCGRCEKCVRTQLQFFVVGKENLACFPSVDLLHAVERINKTSAHLLPQWRSILDELGAGDLREAVVRLIDRTEWWVYPGRLSRLKRKFHRSLRGLTARSPARKNT